MPERFRRWLCHELDGELQAARAKLDEAARWSGEAARLVDEARAALTVAAKEEGGRVGPKALEANQVMCHAARELADARLVESLRRGKIRECENQLARAEAGIPQAQQLVVEAWSKNYQMHIMGPISPLPVMPTVEEVRAAAAKPGVSLTTMGRLSGAVNRWLDRG
jgi:hypothetical protein